MSPRSHKRWEKPIKLSPLNSFTLVCVFFHDWNHYAIRAFQWAPHNGLSYFTQALLHRLRRTESLFTVTWNSKQGDQSTDQPTDWLTPTCDFKLCTVRASRAGGRSLRKVLSAELAHSLSSCSILGRSLRSIFPYSFLAPGWRLRSW